MVVLIAGSFRDSFLIAVKILRLSAILVVKHSCSLSSFIWERLTFRCRIILQLKQHNIITEHSLNKHIPWTVENVSELDQLKLLTSLIKLSPRWETSKTKA